MKNPQFLILVGLSCLLLIASLFIGARIEHGGIVVRNNPVVAWLRDHTRRVSITENKNSGWIKDALAQHIKVLTLKDGKVHVESDGFFTIRPDLGEASANFMLNISDDFYGPPDHHAWLKVKLLKIDPDGVDMSYENGFDHRSFGKNLITIDRGLVHFPWKPQTPKEAAAHEEMATENVPITK